MPVLLRLPLTRRLQPAPPPGVCRSAPAGCSPAPPSRPPPPCAPPSASAARVPRSAAGARSRPAGGRVRGGLAAASLVDELLHQGVLARVKGDHHQPPAGPQHGLGRLEPA